MSKRNPLPKGTIISYVGLLAEVVEDDGGEELLVLCLEKNGSGKLIVQDTVPQKFKWDLNGTKCEVVSSDRGVYEYRLKQKSLECRVSGTGWLCAYIGGELIPVLQLTESQIQDWNGFNPL